MVIGLVGTTIAPWMQFYLQSSIVEKGITAREYKTSRWDVILLDELADGWGILEDSTGDVWFEIVYDSPA